MSDRDGLPADDSNRLFAPDERSTISAMDDGPSSQLVPFGFGEDEEVHFERLAKTNGSRFWFARDLMRALGYQRWAEFRKLINRAATACMNLNIDTLENFVSCKREIDGKEVDDYKLSRFACCLTAINGDPKLRPVAEAQAYFIGLAEFVQSLPVPAEAVERIVVREEISKLEGTLSQTAASAEVEFYGRFQNAGYRGMYNMDYRDLKRFKGIPDMKKSLLDFMGKDELAGNFFRLTLTEGRIRMEKARGQRRLEEIAEGVGRRVRRTMIEETGVAPENLPIGQDIATVRRALRNSNREFKELDNLEREREVEAEYRASLPAPSREIVPNCPECEAGSVNGHFGSPQCTSGSLASGGDVAHCSCDYCC